MRLDHTRLIIECGRAGPNQPTKYSKRIRYEEDSDYEQYHGGFVSSARRRHQDHKSLGDRLSPLEGFLRSRCGRPWDDVYKEFREAVDTRNMQGYHVKTHLHDMVRRHVYIGAKTGRVFDLPGTRGYGSFYVHPWTGILHEEPRRRFRLDRKVDTDFVKLNASECFVQQKGIWYYARYATVKVNVPYQWNTKLYYQKEEREYSAKRQLGKKQLRLLRALKVIR